MGMSGIVYLYGFLIHQGLLYVNKVLPQNVVTYASQVLDVVMQQCITVLTGRQQGYYGYLFASYLERKRSFINGGSLSSFPQCRCTYLQKYPSFYLCS